MKNKKETSFCLAPAISLMDEPLKKQRLKASIKDTLYIFLTASAVILSLLFAADKIGLFEVTRGMFDSAVLISAFFACAYMLFPYKWLILLASHIGILIFIWQEWQKLFDGAVLLVREMILLVNEFYGTYYRYPTAPNEFKLSSYYSAIVFLLILLLSSLLCFLLSRGSGVIICGLSLLGVFFVSTNLSEKAIYLPILLGILAFLSAFSLYASGLSRKERKNRFIAFASKGGFGNGIIAVVLVGALSIGAVFAFVPREEQVYEAPLAEMAKDPNAVYELLPLIKSFNPFNLSTFKWRAGVGSGKLNAGLRSEGTGKTDLMVLIPVKDRASVHPYLKGYVGSHYNSQKMQWEDLPDKVYSDYGQLFNDVNASQMTIQSFAKNQAKLLSMHDMLAQTAKVLVKNIDANKKYTYFPYNSTTDYYNSTQFNGVDFYRDTYIKGENVGDSFYFDTIRLYDDNAASALGALLPESYKLYQGYSAFAIENYLELPQKGVERIKAAGLEMRNDIIAAEKKSDNSYITTMMDEDGNLIGLEDSTEFSAVDISVSSAVFSVKQYLKSHAVYDLACGETPRGKDFAEYFLYESNKGYCVHFATAGTLLFRAMGIPARYVEGYIITGDASDSWKEIPDSNAHAWVEIFTDVSGWQPVEVTPGFSVAEIAPPSQNIEVPPEIVENVSSELASEPSLPSESEASSEISSLVSSELVESESTSSVTSNGSAEQGSNAEADVEEESKPKPMSTSTKIILLIILVPCVILLALWLAGLLTRRRRDRRFDGNDSNIAYRYIYDYTLRLLDFVGIRQAVGEDDEAFAQRAQQKLAADFAFDSSDNELLNMTKNALLAKFSDKTLDKQEVLKAVEFYRRVSATIYGGVSIFKRFCFIFFKLM